MSAEGQQQQQEPPVTYDDYDSEEEWLEHTGGDADSNQQPTVSTYKEPKIEEMNEEEKELAGDIVPIEFKLPNGEIFKRSYVLGHTVAWIKAQLEELCGLPYEKTVLKLNGKVLIDPLSLSDLPFVPRQPNVVEVVLKQ